MSLVVQYMDYPPGAQGAATAEIENVQQFSDTDVVLHGDYDSAAYATLEPHNWPLDGSREILADSPENLGVWNTDISDIDGNLLYPVTLTVQFSAPYTATGLTFEFSPATIQYVSKLRCAWYNGTQLLRDGEYHPDDANWVLQELVSSFDRIVITFLQTNRQGFVKLGKLQIGQITVLKDSEIVQCTTTNEVDISLSELSYDTLDLTIRDTKNRSWAPQQNQQFFVYQNDELQGCFYIDTTSRSGQYLYDFSAHSAIGQLEDEFLGGIYDDVPLNDLLTSILGELEFARSARFTDVTVTGYLPISSRREALQQICFAYSILPVTYGSNRINFVELPTQYTGIIPASRIMLGATTNANTRIGKVQVYSHKYTPSEETEELIMDEAVNGESVMYTFEEPHHSYEITGGTIVESSANWVKISANGNVSLTAKKYVHSTTTYTKSNKYATSAERNNVVSVDEATLVNSANAQSVADRLFNYYENRWHVEADIVAANEIAGSMWSFENPWGAQIAGYISSMSNTYTANKRTATITILGRQIDAAGVYNYAGELYAGDTEIVY